MRRLLHWFGGKARLFARSRRRLVAAIVAVIMLAGIAAAVHYLNAPATGHSIAPVDARKLIKTAAKPAVTPAQHMTNPYFSLALPPGYNVQSGDQPPAGLLYSQTITKPGDFGSLIIAISVQNLPPGGLAGDSSYQLRTEEPVVYNLTTRSVGGDGVHIASDSQSSSVVGFWPHGAYLGTISVSAGTDAPSGDGNAEELQALQPLLDAWHWQ